MQDDPFPTEKGEGLGSNKVLTLIFSVLLIPGLLLVLTWGYNPGERARLETLRRLAAETPVYPDFKELDSAWNTKSNHGTFTVYYDAPAYSAGFERVKKFYTDALTREGWSLSGEEDDVWGRGVGFRKGKYMLTVVSGDEAHSDWDYAVRYALRY